MHLLKNVPPPFNVDLLLYDAEAEIFYFGRRVKEQGADLMLGRPSCLVDFDSQPFAAYASTKGAVTYWKMLIKPC